MEYRIPKTDLANNLLVETLQSLNECYQQLRLPLYVVGATARDIALRLLRMDDVPRRTLDLDVAMALSNWSEYEHLTTILLQNGFVKSPEKQRFYYPFANKMNYEVDIVPFGPIAKQEHSIRLKEDAYTSTSIVLFKSALFRIGKRREQ